MKQAMWSTYVISVLAFFVLQTAAVSTEELCPAVVKCLAKMDRGEDCNILPVPRRARLDPVPNGQPIELRAMRKGVWLYRDGAYQALIVRQGQHLVIVDMPDSDNGSNKPNGSGTRLTNAILKVMRGLAVRRLDMVYSHGHLDHIGASVRLHTWACRVYPRARINIYAAPNVAGVINASVSKRAVLPTRTIRDRASIVLGKGLRLDMTILGGHDGGDLAIHIPRFGAEKSILMYVDVVFPRWTPFFFIGITTDVGRYISVQDELLKYDFDVFLAGHLNPGTRKDVADNRRFTRDLLSAAEEARVSVTPEDLAAAGLADSTTPGLPGFGDIWLQIKAVDDARNRRCARTMIEKWGCTLGGVAPTIQGHCFTMDEHINVDR